MELALMAVLLKREPLLHAGQGRRQGRHVECDGSAISKGRHQKCLVLNPNDPTC